MPVRRRFHIPAIILALALLSVSLWRQQRVADLPSRSARCVRVIDGDTILLERGERVRLIGVDTPEIAHPQGPEEKFGKEASAFTERLAEGKPVRLEFGREREDAYGRTLAYVYLEDGTLLNAELIRQGLGTAYTRYPFRFEEEFIRLEQEARQNGRGMWAR
ncbi:MAG: thermonuclease family protein [Acidobacteria bacterium]|nr:thermonuclease family protein [Acidobacteriota bacterium]